MKKPKRFSAYKCPHNKLDGVTQLPYSVSGRYCRNNCGLYKNGECKKWKKE